MRNVILRSPTFLLKTFSESIFPAKVISTVFYSIFMDHSESSEATISQERALEVSEAPNHLFSHQSDTSMVSSSAAECAGYEKRQLNEANPNTSEGVNPLLELAANDNQTATNPAAKKRKKSCIVKNLLVCIPKYIIHPIRLGKRLRSTFKRSNYKTIIKDVRDESPRDDERHPSDIDNAQVNCCNAT